MLNFTANVSHTALLLREGRQAYVAQTHPCMPEPHKQYFLINSFLTA